MNLLELNNDVLNIIGDYVKRDNVKEEIFTRVDKWTYYFKKKENGLCKQNMWWLIYYKLQECSYDEIDEYIKTRDLEQYE